jgi:ribosomal protein S12 methylthiotransferase
MEAMRDAHRVCPYLDMPLQHASDRMLTAMRRGITKRRTAELIRSFRATVPGLAIRTTFIVGFPGESEADFEELLAFMEEMRFERLGIFTYSREAGSPAWGLPDQVPEEVKAQRLERAMLLQQRIAREINQTWVGRTLEVLVEARDQKNPRLWIGRSRMDAPEVDGNVLVHSRRPLEPGSFHEATIRSVQDYDLVAEL